MSFISYIVGCFNSNVGVPGSDLEAVVIGYYCVVPDLLEFYGVLFGGKVYGRAFSRVIGVSQMFVRCVSTALNDSLLLVVSIGRLIFEKPVGISGRVCVLRTEEYG